MSFVKKLILSLKQMVISNVGYLDYFLSMRKCFLFTMIGIERYKNSLLSLASFPVFYEKNAAKIQHIDIGACTLNVGANRSKTAEK